MPEAAIAPPPSPAPAPAPPPPAPAPAPSAPVHPRQRLQAALQKAADAPEPAKPTSEPVKPAPKNPDSEPPPSDDRDDLEPRAEPAQPADDPPKDPPPGDKNQPKGKTSPWKLLDTYKARVLSVEKELAEARSRITDPQAADSLNKRLEAAEKRRTELEDEIRYVNYSKSQEFVDKYQKPFEEAWSKASTDMSELTVDLGEGNQRQATVHDLHALANMKLGERRKAATAWFGDAADDVMAHVRKIQDLSEAQNKALEDARKNGAERQQQMSEQSQAKQRALQDELSTLWTKSNEEAVRKQEFLRPKEGDDEWNSRLERAKALVETSWTANSADPKLTPEQRAEVVRKHIALRNRAIAYSPLKLENNRLRAKVAEQEEALKAYQGSEPANGNGAGRTATSTAPANPMEAAKQRLQKYAT